MKKHEPMNDMHSRIWSMLHTRDDPTFQSHVGGIKNLLRIRTDPGQPTHRSEIELHM